MKINRQHVIDTFANYVKNYNDNDSKVKLKIEHTYRVAGLCQMIGASQGLTGEELDLCWLTGMLHDIGRFEQLRRFNTFNDAMSVDHAMLGCEILFKDGMIRDFVQDDGEDKLLYDAIGCHSAYKIPENFDERTKMFSNILRDADKIDILKVNCDFPLEEIYNATTEEIKNGDVTLEVMEAVRERHTVLRSLKKTAIDNVVGHISLVFELVYPESVEIVKKQGYLDKMMAFESDNEKTRRAFVTIRDIINDYMNDR